MISPWPAPPILVATGIVCLTDPLNDFIGEVAGNAATVEFVDRNALMVGTIIAVDDIFLRSGATDSGALTLNGNLTTTSPTGQILLQSDSGATQANGTVITTSELLVGGDLPDEGTGIFGLLGANAVGVIATDIVGELHFATTATPFVFASVPLNYTSDCGTTKAITGIAATDKIHLVADGITINDQIVSTTVFLESTSGVTQGGGGSILTTNLMLSGMGLFDLTNPANDTDNLAADITGTLGFVDVNDVNIAELTCVFAGVTLSGVDVSIDLTLDTSAGNGDITQNANAPVIVEGTTLLTAGSGVICLTNPLNDFMDTVTASGSTVELVDRNALTTGVIDAVNDIYLRSGATDSGALTLNGNLTTTAPTGQILLQSDSGATQANGTVITTSELLVGGDLADEGTGIFGLLGANVVGVIATDIVGELHFATTATPFVFASNALNYISDCGTTEAITGIAATDKIHLVADGITINDQIVSTTVFLESTNGVTQGAGGSILTTNLMLSGTGLFDLTNPANDTDNLAADITGTLSFVDVDEVNIAELTCAFAGVTLSGVDISIDLTIDTSAGNGDITQNANAPVIVEGTTLLTAGSGVICLTNPLNDFMDTVTASGSTVELVDRNDLTTGVIDAVDDIYLRSGATDSGALTLNGNLTTTSPTGQILLQSDRGVTQAVGTVISTNELLLGGNLADEGSGDFVLNQANLVNFLAADLENNLEFVDTTSLVIADLTYDSVCDTTEVICGLNVGGNLILNIGGSLTQTAAAIVQGSSSLIATQEICLTGGDCTGDGLNDNDFVGQVTATAMTVEIVDANALTVGNITAVDDIFLRSGDNGAGTLTLDGNLTTTSPAGQILLQSDSGVTQAAGTVITTNELLLGGDLVDEGSGNFVLDQANVVNFLAADLENNLEFVDSTSLVISDLTYDSDCDTTEVICGLNVGGNLVLSVTGSLAQTAAVIVGGTSNLAATTIICFTGGDCSGDGLNDNNFAGQVTATAMTVEIVDANALTVGNITAVDDIFLRSGDNGAGALTLNGNLTTTSPTGQILLQSDSGVIQAAGTVITTNELLLGGDLADEGSGNFVLNQANVVDFLAADLENNLNFVDSTSLVIADLTYNSICNTTEAICGLNVGGNLILNIGGSLTQTASVIVLGTSYLTATVRKSV